MRRSYWMAASLWTNVGPPPSRASYSRIPTVGTSPVNPTSSANTMSKSPRTASARAPCKPFSSWMVAANQSSHPKVATSTLWSTTSMSASGIRSSIALPDNKRPIRCTGRCQITGAPTCTPNPIASARLLTPISTKMSSKPRCALSTWAWVITWPLAAANRPLATTPSRPMTCAFCPMK